MDVQNINWIYFLIIVGIIILIIWIIAGGKNHDFIGISPILEHDDISYRKEEITLSVCSKSKFQRSMSFKQLSAVKEINDEKDRMINMDEDTLKEYCNTKPKNMSNGEAFAKIIMEEIYGVPFKKIRPDWLKNPETNKNLELDLFSDNVIVNGSKYSIAVEYSGMQHYVYPNKFFKNTTDFKNQLRRDIYKREMCDLNDVFLITIPYYITPENMKQYVIDAIPEPMLPERYKSDNYK
jgi:hypothetical protein